MPQHFNRCYTNRCAVKITGIACDTPVSTQFRINRFLLIILADFRFSDSIGKCRRSKDRKISWVHVHDTIPFSSCHYIVVIRSELLNLHKCIVASYCRSQRLVIMMEGFLACNLPRLLCFKMLGRHRTCCKDRILDSGKISVLQFGSQQWFCLFDGFLDLRESFEVTLSFVSEVNGTECRVTGRRQSPLIFLLVKLHLAPSHELRPANPRQMIKLCHGRKNLLRYDVAKLLDQPVIEMKLYLISLYGVDVPSHIHD